MNPGSLISASVSEIVALSPDAIILIDEAQSIRFFSPAAEQLFGYASHEVIGQPVTMLIPARFQAQHGELVRGFAASADRVRRKDARREVFGLRKDGSEFPAEASIAKTEPKTGAVHAVILRDITERKRAEQALQKERDFTAAILDTASALVAVSDREGRIVRANRACEQATGCRAEALQGKLLWDVFSCAHEAAEFQATFRNLCFTRLPAEHENCFMRDGGRRSIAWSDAVLLGGGGAVEYVICTGIDVTEHRFAEKALAKEANLLRTLIDLWPDHIFVKDAEGRYIVNNSAHRSALGILSLADVVGRTDIQFFSKELAAEYQADEQAILASGKPAVDREDRITRADGAEVWLSTRKIPWRDHSGGIVGLVGMSQDITDRKRVQEELEKYALQLQEKNDKLRIALASAREATQLKSQFLAKMSHEIRTPMNGVIGMIQLLLNTTLEEEQRDYAAFALRSAQALLRLLNDILDLSKIEAGKMELEHLPFDLTIVVQDVVSLFVPRTSAKGLGLTCVVDSDVPRFVVGDSGRLRQILTNLLGNAVKFTERGGVSVRAERVSIAEGETTIQFSVEDTGAGISPDQLPRLFHNFVQADNSTTRKHGGTGLGLAISKQLAEMMGGKIGAESRSGQGSTFWFTVALEVQKETPAPVVERHRVRRLGAGAGGKVVALEPKRDIQSARILLAEDNQINQKVVVGILKKSGYQIDVVENGLAAVEALATGRYDLVLMDIHMPVMDGYEATAEIRRREDESSHMPIVALTAAAMSGDREQCLQAGMDDFISKPISAETLCQTVERWINSSEPQMLAAVSAAQPD